MIVNQGILYNPGGPGGYYCGNCGIWVVQGGLHTCQENQLTYTYPPIGVQLQEIIDRLDAIEKRLKGLDR